MLAVILIFRVFKTGLLIVLDNCRCWYISVVNISRFIRKGPLLYISKEILSSVVLKKPKNHKKPSCFSYETFKFVVFYKQSNV
jgi:hypothetical protein